MAPTKTPIFAVCGGVSVDTVVAEAGRRGSNGNLTRRSSRNGLAESLYADLLWDCDGANVENTASGTGMASASPLLPDEDFADVFGGPPKFVTLSSHLSFLRRLSRVSRAGSKDVSFFEPSGDEPIDASPSSTQSWSFTSQKAVNSTTFSPSSAKSGRLRSPAQSEFSSHIYYSDGENQHSFQKNCWNPECGDDFYSVLSSGSSCVKGSNMFVGQGESSSANMADRLEDTDALNNTKEDLRSMKENIEGFPEVLSNKKLFRSYGKSVSMKSDQFGQYAKVHRNGCATIMKKNKNREDRWVTIKDIHCQTELSRFPPPSRPPPVIDIEKSWTGGDGRERRKISENRQSFSESQFSSASCVEGSILQTTRITEDAAEIADKKIRIVFEAKEKAKALVEKKLRERERVQQLKEGHKTDDINETECELTGDMKDWLDYRRNIRTQHSKSGMNKQARQMRITKHCIRKATQGLERRVAAKFEERFAELTDMHNFSELPFELKLDGSPSIERKQRTCRSETSSGPISSESERIDEYQKQFVYENRCAEFDEQAFLASKDSLSTSCCSTQQKVSVEPSSLDGFCSMSNTSDALNSAHASKTSSMLSKDAIEQNPVEEILEKKIVKLDHHQRTADRMARALEEKKQRDLEHQKEQAERQSVAEMLDEDVKAWAGGNKGNLEALLCSLHRVLWPECEWKRVSPSDLSTVETLKKCYRRATLCVHPDKVQQRGATVAQKYLAEKIFYLLREAAAKYKF